VAQVVEHMPKNHKGLTSHSVLPKKKGKDTPKRHCERTREELVLRVLDLL
jgi:hypothetical protein